MKISNKQREIYVQWPEYVQRFFDTGPDLAYICEKKWKISWEELKEYLENPDVDWRCIWVIYPKKAICYSDLQEVSEEQTICLKYRENGKMHVYIYLPQKH